MRSSKNTAILPNLNTAVIESSGYSSSEEAHRTNAVFTPSAIRSQKEPISATTTRMFASVLLGLFIIVLLIAFLMGINVYQSLDTMAEAESTQRVEQSFLANVIHSNDIHHAIRVGEGPEGRSLVFFETVDGVGDFETRLYAYRGSVLYEYALAGTPYAPQKAITLFESDMFDFTYSDTLLTVYTDSGSVDISLRSEEAAQ